MGSFITKERCQYCEGNILCTTEQADDVLANLRTWTCLMCSRDARPAELISFRGHILAQQIMNPKASLHTSVWNRHVKGAA